MYKDHIQMAKNSNDFGKVAIEYIESFPEYPTLTIAKMLMSDYPSIYDNLESYRSIVRHHRNETIKRSDKNEKYERTPEQKVAARSNSYPLQIKLEPDQA